MQVKTSKQKSRKSGYEGSPGLSSNSGKFGCVAHMVFILQACFFSLAMKSFREFLELPGSSCVVTFCQAALARV
jgi:hypothetical protein